MEKLSYKIDVFEGPMDLLLHLISKHILNSFFVTEARGSRDIKKRAYG